MARILLRRAEGTSTEIKPQIFIQKHLCLSAISFAFIKSCGFTKNLQMEYSHTTYSNIASIKLQRNHAFFAVMSNVFSQAYVEES